MKNYWLKLDNAEICDLLEHIENRMARIAWAAINKHGWDFCQWHAPCHGEISQELEDLLGDGKIKEYGLEIHQSEKFEFIDLQVSFSHDPSPLPINITLKITPMWNIGSGGHRYTMRCCMSRKESSGV